MPLSKGTNDASWRHRSRDWTEKTPSSSLKISPNSNYQEQIQREKKIDSDFQELDEFESLQAPPPSEVQLFMRCGWFNVGPITVNITTSTTIVFHDGEVERLAGSDQGGSFINGDH